MHMQSETREANSSKCMLSAIEEMNCAKKVAPQGSCSILWDRGKQSEGSHQFHRDEKLADGHTLAHGCKKNMDTCCLNHEEDKARNIFDNWQNLTELVPSDIPTDGCKRYKTVQASAPGDGTAKTVKYAAASHNHWQTAGLSKCAGDNGTSSNWQLHMQGQKHMHGCKLGCSGPQNHPIQYDLRPPELTPSSPRSHNQLQQPSLDAASGREGHSPLDTRCMRLSIHGGRSPDCVGHSPLDGSYACSIMHEVSTSQDQERNGHHAERHVPHGYELLDSIGVEREDVMGGTHP
jgi:hypothetical protein